MSRLEMTPIGRRESGSVTARCAIPYCAIRLPASPIELSAATLTSGVTEVGLHAHRVVAAVDVQRRAGHVARAVAEQVGGRRADVVGRDVAAQRRALLDDVLHRREAGD